MTDNRPAATPEPDRRPSPLHAALGLLTGISIAALYLLHRKVKRTQRRAHPLPPALSWTDRLARTGLEVLPLLLPLLLERRHEQKTEAVAAPPKQRSVLHRIGVYVLPVLLCLALGGVAGWLQRDALTEWYPTLLKPAGTPPNWLFPAAWGIIYILMGISAGRILTAEGPHREAMTLWGIQLGVNFLWSILFFVVRSPLLGMIDIVILDALVLLCIARSYPVRRDAAWLFVPYLVWILYATYLNGWILAANGTGL